jgi:hypothetical protein
MKDIWDQELLEYSGIVPSCILTGKPTSDWCEDDDDSLFGWKD